jgi:hypothetical protein
VKAELALTYARGRWRARGHGIDLEHAELRGLEALVEQSLAGAGVREAAIRFDMSSLPRWMHQHQAHYFNYTLRLAPSAASS